jgi:hypothetical protein
MLIVEKEDEASQNDADCQKKEDPQNCGSLPF